MALVIPGLFCALGLGLGLLGLLLGLGELRRPRRSCPGPRLGRWRRLLPIWIFRHASCGYDLRGPGPFHPCTCPECGRRVTRVTELCRSSRAWRPVPIGISLVLVGLLLHRYPPLRADLLVAAASTDLLLDGEAVFGTATLVEARAELRRRALDHQLDETQIGKLVRLLVHDLRDDALLENAKAALGQLAIFGVYDEEPLLAALDSDDVQQRWLAATTLWELPRTGPAPERLVEAAIEALGSDGVESNAACAVRWLGSHREEAKPFLLRSVSSPDRQRRDLVLNHLFTTALTDGEVETVARAAIRSLGLGQVLSGSSFRFLLEHAAAVEPLLAEAMISPDPQTRLLAAAVAGCGGRTSLAGKAIPILVDHLADNAISGDAIIAARAIFGFGPAAAEPLDPYRTLAPRGQAIDEQQRQQVEYLIARLTSDESEVRLQLRLPLARLTQASVSALAVEPTDLRMPIAAEPGAWDAVRPGRAARLTR